MARCDVFQMYWEPSRHLQRAAEEQQQMAAAACNAPAPLPYAAWGFSAQGMHSAAQKPGLMALGAAAQTQHCATSVPQDLQFAAGVRAAVRMAAHAASGARLAAQQPSHRFRAILELSSCPKLAGCVPARRAAQR